MKGGFVYITTNKTNTVLYTGVTSHLEKRMWQHRNHVFQNSFTARYNCSKLVYYQWFDSIMSAIVEEKRIKAGSRRQKVKFVESMNPEWNDLTDSIQGY